MKINNSNYWLFLEKSPEKRAYKGVLGYLDKTGEQYNYDSNVQNSQNVKINDTAIIRVDDEIIGYGNIKDIIEKQGTKDFFRCPKCNSTNCDERKKHPKWRCSKCKEEFSNRIKTTDNVTIYNALIDSFVVFKDRPDVNSVKDCAVGDNGIKSQLAMIRLDTTKLRELFHEIDFNGNVENIKNKSQKEISGQGHRQSYEERRAIELHAMKIAEDLYIDKGWKVKDTSSNAPFDLYAVKDNKKKYIEVKGTTLSGKKIILTRGEVEHVDEHKDESVLIVVANIILNKENGKWIASNGKILVHDDPWKIDRSKLIITHYRYEV